MTDINQPLISQEVYEQWRKATDDLDRMLKDLNGYQTIKEARLNRKWQRIFAGLIILNAIIWYNILST